MNPILAGQGDVNDPLAELFGPTVGDLDQLIVEAGLIEAEVELLDVEISLIDRRDLTVFEVRRIRRAERAVLVQTLILGITQAALGGAA